MSLQFQGLISDLAGSGVRVDSAGCPLKSSMMTRKFDSLARYFAQINLPVDESFSKDHFDSGESALLARQLLFIQSKVIYTLFTVPKARKFIPVDNNIPAGAEQISTPVWTQVGLAKLVSSYGDDFPRSDLYLTENLSPIKSIANSYAYSVQDLRRAAMAGIPLDARRAATAALVHQKQIEAIASVGDTTTGLPGMAKGANVTILTAGGGITGAWASATSTQIFSDLNTLAYTPVSQSKDVWEPDTMLFSTAAWGIVSQKPANTFSEKTLLRSFLENNPYIKNADLWPQLDTAGAAGVTRVVVYKRDPMCLDLKIPVEFEQFAPQMRNLEFVINCHSRIGGTIVYQPLSMCYGDGV